MIGIIERKHSFAAVSVAARCHTIESRHSYLSAFSPSRSLLHLFLATLVSQTTWGHHTVGRMIMSSHYIIYHISLYSSIFLNLIVFFLYLSLLQSPIGLLWKHSVYSRQLAVQKKSRWPVRAPTAVARHLTQKVSQTEGCRSQLTLSHNTDYVLWSNKEEHQLAWEKPILYLLSGRSETETDAEWLWQLNIVHCQVSDLKVKRPYPMFWWDSMWS